MKIEYVVSVKQVIDTAKPGEDPKPVETVLADFTGGPNAASAVLSSLAESVQKGKKVVGLAAVLKAVNETLEEQNKKAREEGKPTLAEALADLLGNKKPGTTTR